MNVEFYEPLFSRTLSIASSIFLASSPIIVVIFVRVFFLGEFQQFRKKKNVSVLHLEISKLRVERKGKKEDSPNGCSANVKK